VVLQLAKIVALRILTFALPLLVRLTRLSVDFFMVVSADLVLFYSKPGIVVVVVSNVRFPKLINQINNN